MFYLAAAENNVHDEFDFPISKDRYMCEEILVAIIFMIDQVSQMLKIMRSRDGPNDAKITRRISPSP